MHRSLMSMQGMPITSEQGLRLGGVQDALFDPVEQRIVALVVDWEEDLVRGPEDVLPITQITELNADVLGVANEMAVSAGLEYDFQVLAEGLMTVGEALTGHPVRLANGEQLGELVDLQFDPQDGSVAFYELGSAEMADTGAPALMVPAHPELEFQPDGLVVPDRLKPSLVRRAGSVPSGVTFLDEDEPVGEEDIEVFRDNPTSPY